MIFGVVIVFIVLSKVFDWFVFCVYDCFVIWFDLFVCWLCLLIVVLYFGLWHSLLRCRTLCEGLGLRCFT